MTVKGLASWSLEERSSIFVKDNLAATCSDDTEKRTHTVNICEGIVLRLRQKEKSKLVQYLAFFTTENLVTSRLRTSPVFRENNADVHVVE